MKAKVWRATVFFLNEEGTEEAVHVGLGVDATAAKQLCEIDLCAEIEWEAIDDDTAYVSVSADPSFHYMVGEEEVHRKHGTAGGYIMHRRHKEEACSLCKKAWSERNKNWRDNNKSHISKYDRDYRNRKNEAAD